jgi:hypothetical protein
MKSVKKIYKCTDCTDGPCFCILPVESVPQYCIPTDHSDLAGNCTDDGTYTESVNWLLKETIHRDKGFSPEILKEILDA